MASALNLIPRPILVSETNGTADILKMCKLIYNGLNETDMKILKERFILSDIKISQDSDFFISLSISDPVLAPLGVLDKPDAYTIQVTKDEIRIDAKNEAGLFYGLTTLMQLPDECCCVTIQDYCAIPIRMIHWDLKGYLPHFEVLKNEFCRLARYKVNYVLLEVEDKYDFKSAPGIAVPDAYTYEELRELSIFAKSLHITIVPKLQCIAHVDYILKHNKYRHLREGGENGQVFQYCPLNPEVETLWKNMCDELIDCFCEHGPYFHIGADESWYLGECPECKKVGKANVYKYRVGKSIDHLVKKGWTPILWDDIVSRWLDAPDALDARLELCSRAIIMYWQYGYGARNNSLPQIDVYQKDGLRVFGASGYAGCDNWAGSLPPLSVRHQNCDAWAKAAVEKNIECVCSTGWTRIGSSDCPSEPHESSWFTILYAAASMWNPETYPIEEFVRILFTKLYKKDVDEDLLAAIINNGEAKYDYHKALESSPDETEALQFLRYAAGAEHIRQTINKLERFMPYYQGKLGNRMESYRLDMLKEMSAEIYNDLINFRSKLPDVISTYYKDVTTKEFVRTRVDYSLKLCEQFKTLIDNTKPY